MKRWQILLLTGSTMLAVLTGLGYFVIEHFVRPSDPFAAINHPLQPWLLKAHILLVPAVVFAVGAIAPAHIFRHIAEGRPQGRRSGLLALVLAALTVLSGYMIQVITNQTLLDLTGWIHLGAGIAFAAFVALHRRITPASREE